MPTNIRKELLTFDLKTKFHLIFLYVYLFSYTNFITMFYLISPILVFDNFKNGPIIHISKNSIETAECLLSEIRIISLSISRRSSSSLCCWNYFGYGFRIREFAGDRSHERECRASENTHEGIKGVVSKRKLVAHFRSTGSATKPSNRCGGTG